MLVNIEQCCTVQSNKTVISKLTSAKIAAAFGRNSGWRKSRIRRGVAREQHDPRLFTCYFEPEAS
jgi:hypothetical protein